MTNMLTPAQSKAARAILAWSQTDLARAAKLGASTVADFERAHRKTQEESLAAMRQALEAEGIVFLAGGAVEARGLAAAGLLGAGQAGRKGGKKGGKKGGLPAPWVTSADLIEWAGRRDGQAGLPLLITHLIRAEKGAEAELHFPAGDSVQRAGWDGFCKVATGSEHLAAGTSVWELGAQRTKLKDKAEDGYIKRTANPLGVNPSKTTFVHVTPHPWPAREAWATAKRAEGVWKDVRVIDGDALVHWIEMHAAVSHWLAVRIGKRPHGLTQLDDAFEEWSLATQTPLTPDIVLVDREDEAASVHKWLSGPSAVMSAQAEAVDEAIAFLYASIARFPAPEREAVLARGIVAETEQAARALLDVMTPLLVVLPSAEVGLAKRLSAKHYVFVAVGSDAGAPSDVTRLTRPWNAHLQEALETLLHDASQEPSKTQRRREARELAQRYAKDAGRSLAVLRRVMPPAPGRRPKWAEGKPSRALLAAMMAGAWDEDDEGDRAIIAKLSGATYEDVVRDLAAHVRDLDGALRKAGSIWKLASVRDAWFLLGGSITEADITLFEDAFKAVLSASDPRFGLSGEERFMAPVRGVHRPHSGYLRRGLEEFAIVLAIFGERASTLSNTQGRVDTLIASLFAGANDERWWSLAQDFRYLAEASPQAFLDAVAHALDQNPSPLRSLFTTDGDGVFDREYLSSLLWAFEVLAWDVDLFARVAQLLVRLAEMDGPGGRWLNRPRNTLKSLFSLWSPQTAVSLEGRLRVLDALRRKSSEVTWELMLKIAPKGHDVSSPTPRPYWRDVDAVKPELVTHALINQGGLAIGDRLLEDVGSDVNRWGSVIDLLQFYSAEWGSRAAAQLEAVEGQLSDPAERLALRAKLRDFLSHHRQFAATNWAVRADELKHWQKLYDALEPTDLAERYAWLYSYKARIERPVGQDFAGIEAALRQRRADTAAAILDAGGIAGLVAVARAADAPGFLGAALMEARPDADALDVLLSDTLPSNDAKAHALAHGLIVRGQEVKNDAWCAALLQRARRLKWGVEAEMRILSAMRFERATWNLAADAGEAVEDAYWRNVSWYMTPDKDASFAAEKFLGAGRPRLALDFVGHHLDGREFAADLLIWLLRACVDGEAQYDPTMTAYHVGRVLTRLEKLGTEATVIASLEWTYYKLLEHSERPPRMLRKAMAEDADMFVELARKVYVADEGSGKAEEADGEYESADAAFVQQAFEVLLDWNWIPGADDAGDVDFDKLKAWVDRARALALASGHLKAIDGRLGSVLAYAKADPDGIWPLKAVRDAIETFGNEAMERGFLTSAYNRRGVTTRGMLDGGGLERALAEDYRKWARASALDWPRTSAWLDKLAKDYEAEARHHDDRADRNDW